MVLVKKSVARTRRKFNKVSKRREVVPRWPTSFYFTGGRKMNEVKKIQPFLAVFSLYSMKSDLEALGDLGLFDQGTNSLGGELKLHSTDVLCLNIDRKRASSLHVRMASVVSGLGAAPGQVTYSTHRRKISCLVTNLRVSWIGRNGKCSFHVSVIYLIFPSVCFKSLS